MTQAGFSLAFPGGGPTFTCSEEVDVNHRTETQFFIDGFQRVLAFYEEFIDSGGQSSRGDSNMQTVLIGVGGGIHTITVQFTQYEGSGDTWGSADTSDGGDSALTLLQALNRAITTNRVDSTQPAELSVHEYASTGVYDPIPVVIRESDLPKTVDEPASSFEGTLTFIEAADLTLDIDNQRRPNDR